MLSQYAIYEWSEIKPRFGAGKSWWSYNITEELVNARQQIDPYLPFSRLICRYCCFEVTAAPYYLRAQGMVLDTLYD